jgi:hypothetical protein
MSNRKKKIQSGIKELNRRNRKGGLAAVAGYEKRELRELVIRKHRMIPDGVAQ